MHRVRTTVCRASTNYSTYTLLIPTATKVEYTCVHATRTTNTVRSRPRRAYRLPYNNLALVHTAQSGPELWNSRAPLKLYVPYVFNFIASDFRMLVYRNASDSSVSVCLYALVSCTTALYTAAVGTRLGADCGIV